MTIKYFQDTDTLHIEFREAEVAEAILVFFRQTIGSVFHRCPRSYTLRTSSRVSPFPSVLPPITQNSLARPAR